MNKLDIGISVLQIPLFGQMNPAAESAGAGEALVQCLEKLWVSHHWKWSRLDGALINVV